MYKDIEKTKKKLENAINNPNFTETEIYKISSEIDKLIIKNFKSKLERGKN